MIENYFCIERNGECFDHLVIQIEDDEGVMFEDVMNMSYEEIKSYEHLYAFIVNAMDATNELTGTNDAQTIITLVNKDDVFIWSIIFGPGENEDDISYVFVDWLKDDNLKYRYAKEEMN